MKKQNTIIESILRNDTVALRLIEARDFKAWNRQLISEMILAEKGSTLSRLIGDSPGGQNLVRWLHKRDRLSATAAWSEVTPATGRVQWKGFKSDPDHFLIVHGKSAVIAIKPDEQYMADKEAEAQQKGKEYNPSSDNSLLYQVVGFARDKRIDNLLIPMPELKDFKKSDNPEADFKAAVDATKKKRAMMLNPDAPATKITGQRGGKPFDRDVTDNIFDLIKDVAGGINAIYTVSGTVADKPMPKRAQAAAIAGHAPGEVPKGQEEWPRVGGVERGKIAARAPQPADFNTEFNKVVKKLLPVFNSLIKQAEQTIRRRVATSGGNEKLAIRMLSQFKPAVDENGKLQATDTIRNTIGNAIKSAWEIPQLNSPEGADALRELNQGGTALMGTILNAIRAKLLDAAS